MHSTYDKAKGKRAKGKDGFRITPVGGSAYRLIQDPEKSAESRASRLTNPENFQEPVVRKSQLALFLPEKLQSS